MSGMQEKDAVNQPSNGPDCPSCQSTSDAYAKHKLKQPVVCVVGPTASGKSTLAIRLACALDGEVVSADSMQIYRGMDIGTGKVPRGEMLVPHHGIDIVDPGQPFSAALFQEYARAAFYDIDERGKRPILCGGTGFYVRAAIDDYDFPEGEQVDNPIREKYNALARTEGPRALWEVLNGKDEASAALIPENDVKRVVRALELLEQGKSYAEQKAMLARIPQRYDAVFIGLEVEPGELVKRIDKRVDAMFDSGLVAEVSSLIDRGFREGVTAPQAIGYKEVVQALDGSISMYEAREMIKLATRRYAKRQRTWFRKDKRIHWIASEPARLDAMADEALAIVENADKLQKTNEDGAL